MGGQYRTVQFVGVNTHLSLPWKMIVILDNNELNDGDEAVTLDDWVYNAHGGINKIKGDFGFLTTSFIF